MTDKNQTSPVSRRGVNQEGSADIDNAGYWWLAMDSITGSHMQILEVEGEARPAKHREVAIENQGSSGSSSLEFGEDSGFLSSVRAREAYNAFRNARKSDSEETKEVHFYNFLDQIELQWECAFARTRQFRDLHALVESAVKGKRIKDFSEPQLNAIDDALVRLRGRMINDEDLDVFLKMFVRLGIDTMRPVFGNNGAKLYNISTSNSDGKTTIEISEIVREKIVKQTFDNWQ